MAEPVAQADATAADGTPPELPAHSEPVMNLKAKCSTGVVSWLCLYFGLFGLDSLELEKDAKPDIPISMKKLKKAESTKGGGRGNSGSKEGQLRENARKYATNGATLDELIKKLDKAQLDRLKEILQEVQDKQDVGKITSGAKSSGVNV